MEAAQQQLSGTDPALLLALGQIGRKVARLPNARRMLLYGSYAKGTNTECSDVDLAVFFSDGDNLLERYRQLVKICRFFPWDIQIQAFCEDELIKPCGIVEEIVMFGIEVPLTRE